MRSSGRWGTAMNVPDPDDEPMDGQPFPKKYQSDHYPENRYAYVPIDVARILGTGSALFVYVAVDAIQLDHPWKWSTAEHVQRYLPGMSLGVIRTGMKRCRNLGLMELRQNEDALGAAFRVRVIYNLGRARYSRGPIIDMTPPRLAGKARSRKIMSERTEADKMPRCSGITVLRKPCGNHAMDGCPEGLCGAHRRQADKRADRLSEGRFLDEVESVDDSPWGLSSKIAHPSPSAASESKRPLTAEKRQRGREAEPNERTAVTSSVSGPVPADAYDSLHIVGADGRRGAGVSGVDSEQGTDALPPATVVPISRGRKTIGTVKRMQDDVRSLADGLGLTEHELYAAVDTILDPDHRTVSLALPLNELEAVLVGLAEVAPLAAPRLVGLTA